jgi:hypothetical protein
VRTTFVVIIIVQEESSPRARILFCKLALLVQLVDFQVCFAVSSSSRSPTAGSFVAAASRDPVRHPATATSSRPPVPESCHRDHHHGFTISTVCLATTTTTTSCSEAQSLSAAVLRPLSPLADASSGLVLCRVVAVVVCSIAPQLLAPPPPLMATTVVAFDNNIVGSNWLTTSTPLIRFLFYVLQYLYSTVFPVAV